MSEEATRRRNLAAAAPVVPPMRRPFRNFTGWQGLPVDTTEEFTADDVKSVVPRLVAIRGPERTYPADPAVWLNKNKMTQTEVALRLANYLLAQKLTATPVDVALTGYELTRRNRPIFPIVRYLTERGYTPDQLADDWRGTYLLKGATQPLRLTDDDEASADVITTLTSGRRLLAHVSRGSLASTRSPAEHKLLRGALGRALTNVNARCDDLLITAVPRSGRFRELAVQWRDAQGMLRSQVLIVTVDRTGAVDGLSRD